MFLSGRYVIALILSLLAVFGASQNPEVTTDSVDLVERKSWCERQGWTCQGLCLDVSPKENSCDKNTLDYKCTCDNGTVPDMARYSGTIPSLLCFESYRRCTDQNLPSCSSAKCGAISVKPFPDDSSSGSSSSSEKTTGSNGGGSSQKWKPAVIVVPIGLFIVLLVVLIKCCHRHSN